MIYGLHRIGVKNTGTLTITSAIEQFNTILGNVTVRESNSPVSDWEQIAWNTIPSTPLNAFSPSASATWWLFEVNTTNWKGAGLIVGEDTILTPSPFDLVLSDTIAGEVYHYSDYFIPLDTYNVASIDIDDATDVAWAIRTDNAYNSDWTDFPNSWDNATIISDLAAETNPRGLHLHFYGTRKVTLEIDNVSGINYFNFASNPDFSKPLEGLAQEFDGVTQYDVVTNFPALDVTKEYFVIMTFEHEYATTPTRYQFLGRPSATNAIMPYFYSSDGQDSLAVGWGNIPSQYGLQKGINGLKQGKNNIIVKLSQNWSDVFAYVNGKFIQGAAGGVFSAGVFTPEGGTLSPQPGANGTGLSIANWQNSFFYQKGKIKILQIIDATGLTLDAKKAYQIYNDGTAEKVYDLNSSACILNMDFGSTVIQDISPNNYSVSVFGGQTQTNFQ